MPKVAHVDDVTGKIAESVIPDRLSADELAASTADAIAGEADSGLTPQEAVDERVPLIGDSRYQRVGEGQQLRRFASLDSTILTNFETSHGWTVAGTGASSAADTSDKIFGTQSLTVTTGTNTWASISKTGLTAIDGTTRRFRIWVKSADLTKVNRMTLLLSSDSGFSNYYAIQNNINNYAEISRVWKSGEWTCVEFQWANATTTGSPTKSAITAIRLLVYSDTGVTATFNINRIEHLADPGGAFPNGVVSLTFDDSFDEHYTLGLARTSLYGMRCTLFPILERLDTAGYLTTAQVDEMAFTHGWEIGAHATTYANHVLSLDGMTSDERRTEFGAITEWQRSRGYESPSFAYPNGNFDEDCLSDVRQHYSLARTAAGITRQEQVPALPLRIKTINALSGATSINALIDTVSATRQWLVIMVHDIVASGGTANAITPTDFNSVIDHLAGTGIPVKSMSDVLAANGA